MKSLILVTILLTAALLAGQRVSLGSNPPANVERGKYLVEEVAMCIQCHTPRDGRGDLIRSLWLKGATVPVSNPFPDKPWAEFAPRIAGLPQYSDDQVFRLLTGGVAWTGKLLRSPMPPFRMGSQDARDVIAYLRSLQ